MSATDAFENLILDHMLGGPAYSPPDPVYIALYSADPGEAGTATTNEISGANYARVAVANDGSQWAAASGGQKANLNAIAFPVAGVGGWGNVLYAGIVDTASGAGLLSLKGPVSPPAGKNVGEGDTFRFEPGDFIVSAD